jgi:DNA-binding NarL/FixJ family response regulator
MYRFLIVDDNHNDALQLSWLISSEYSHEAECEFATTRKDALEWLDPNKHKPVDAVLLDLNLPDSQGLETYRSIRAAAPDVAILILSGRNDDRGLRDLLIDEGAAGYLDKGHVDSRLVFENLRDAARRATSTTRIPAEDSKLMIEAEKRGHEYVETVSRSLPPARAQAQALLSLIRQTINVGKQNAVMSKEIGYLRRGVQRLEESDQQQDRRHDETDKRLDEVDNTGRFAAQEAGHAKRLSEDNKRRLKQIAIALAAIVYALNEGDKLVKLIGSLLGAAL